MFTGIVEELGTLRSASPERIVVTCRTVTEDSPIGASMSVNGVCLTVVKNDAESLTFDVSPETRARSTLGDLAEGSPVNLERPVTLATRLGGHLVQGHVDAVGTIARLDRNGEGAVLTVEAPDAVARYLVEKGSVAVDGVSLTVASRNGGSFDVALVPHTLDVTTLGRANPGDPVNLEADVIAKYVEGLIPK